MEKYKITVSDRQNITPNQLRRENRIPATLYGPQFESRSLEVDAKDFSMLPPAAYSHLIDLEYADGRVEKAIIRQVQRTSTKDKVLNIQFYKVRLDKKLTVTVPIKLTGISQAAVEGAQLFEASTTADVECLPADIPDFIEGDLAVLVHADDVLHYSDLKVSDSIRILNPLDEVVCKAIAPKVSATPAAGDAAASGKKK